MMCRAAHKRAVGERLVCWQCRKRRHHTKQCRKPELSGKPRPPGKIGGQCGLEVKCGINGRWLTIDTGSFPCYNQAYSHTPREPHQRAGKQPTSSSGQSPVARSTWRSSWRGSEPSTQVLKFWLAPIGDVCILSLDFLSPAQSQEDTQWLAEELRQRVKAVHTSSILVNTDVQ